MKKLSLSIVFFSFVALCLGQNARENKTKVIGEHQGFYLSMALGPNFMNVTSESNYSGNVEFSGVGALFDLKLGGSVAQNLILHATLTSSVLSSPKITSNGMSQNSSNKVSLGEAFIGAGLSYYSPANILISGSLGMANFSLIDEEEDLDISTDRGFGFQLKVGKEWWVSHNWGLGVALTYNHTGLTNKPGGGVEEVLKSNNFGIVFNASLH